MRKLFPKTFNIIEIEQYIEVKIFRLYLTKNLKTN